MGYHTIPPCLVTVCVFAVFALVHPVHATSDKVIYLAPNGTDNATGTSISQAVGTLARAIELATVDDVQTFSTIRVLRGSYVVREPIQVNSSLVIESFESTRGDLRQFADWTTDSAGETSVVFQSILNTTVLALQINDYVPSLTLRGLTFSTIHASIIGFPQFTQPLRVGELVIDSCIFDDIDAIGSFAGNITVNGTVINKCGIPCLVPETVSIARTVGWEFIMTQTQVSNCPRDEGNVEWTMTLPYFFFTRGGPTVIDDVDFYNNTGGMVSLAATYPTPAVVANIRIQNHRSMANPQTSNGQNFCFFCWNLGSSPGSSALFVNMDVTGSSFPGGFIVLTSRFPAQVGASIQISNLHTVNTTQLTSLGLVVVMQALGADTTFTIRDSTFRQTWDEYDSNSGLSFGSVLYFLGSMGLTPSYLTMVNCTVVNQPVGKRTSQPAFISLGGSSRVTAVNSHFGGCQVHLYTDSLATMTYENSSISLGCGGPVGGFAIIADGFSNITFSHSVIDTGYRLGGSSMVIMQRTRSTITVSDSKLIVQSGATLFSPQGVFSNLYFKRVVVDLVTNEDAPYGQGNTLLTVQQANEVILDTVYISGVAEGVIFDFQLSSIRSVALTNVVITKLETRSSNSLIDFEPSGTTPVDVVVDGLYLHNITISSQNGFIVVSDMGANSFQTSVTFRNIVANDIHMDHNSRFLSLLTVQSRVIVENMNICVDNPGQSRDIISCMEPDNIQGSVQFPINETVYSGGCDLSVFHNATVLSSASATIPMNLCGKGRSHTVHHSYGENDIASFDWSVDCVAGGVEGYIESHFGSLTGIVNQHPPCPKDALELQIEVGGLSRQGNRLFSFQGSDINTNMTWRDEYFSPNPYAYNSTVINKVDGPHLAVFTFAASPATISMATSALHVASKFLGLALYLEVTMSFPLTNQLGETVQFTPSSAARFVLVTDEYGRTRNVTLSSLEDVGTVAQYRFTPVRTGKVKAYIKDTVTGSQSDTISFTAVWVVWVIIAGVVLFIILLAGIVGGLQYYNRRKSRRLRDTIELTSRLLVEQESDISLQHHHFLKRTQMTSDPTLCYLDNQDCLHLCCELPGQWHVLPGAHGSITARPHQVKDLIPFLNDLRNFVCERPPELGTSTVTKKAHLLDDTLTWSASTQTPTSTQSTGSSGKSENLRRSRVFHNLLSSAFHFHNDDQGVVLMAGGAVVLRRVRLPHNLTAWVCPEHAIENDLSSCQPYDLLPQFTAEMRPVSPSYPDVHVKVIKVGAGSDGLESDSSVGDDGGAFKRAPHSRIDSSHFDGSVESEIVRQVQACLQASDSGRKMRITQIHVLRNPHLESSFQERDRVMSLTGRDALPRPLPGSYTRERQQTLSKLDAQVLGRNGLVFGWHGVSKGATRAMQIVQTGFSALSLLNNGWYGRGVYHTSEPEYAQFYASGPKKSKPNTEHMLVLSWCLTGKAFPVVGRMDRSGDPDHAWHAGYPGYDSHYSLVSLGGLPYHKHARDSAIRKRRREEEESARSRNIGQGQQGGSDSSGRESYGSFDDTEVISSGNNKGKGKAQLDSFQGAPQFRAQMPALDASSEASTDSSVWDTFQHEVSQSKKMYDEIVIWQENAILPRFAVYYTLDGDDVQEQGDE